MTKAFSQMNRIERGFGLVEVLVAMLIGMLTIVVILQTLATAENQRRTVSSGSDAQISGALALHTIERDVRLAGFGLSQSTDVIDVCGATTVLAYNSARSSANITYSAGNFLPIVINPAGFAAADANTDIILINYSGSNFYAGGGLPIDDSYAAAPSFYQVSSNVAGQTFARIGFHNGDLALAVENGKSCRIAQVTGLPRVVNAAAADECGQTFAGAQDSQQNVIIGTGSFANYYNRSGGNCVVETTTYNKDWSSGHGAVDYVPPADSTVLTSGARLYSLGPPTRFVSRAYAIRGGRLTSCNMMTQDCTSSTAANWTTLADNIVSLRAEYARDTNANNAIENNEWSQTAPAGSAQWRSTVAARVVVVARSRNFERDIVTTASPTWLGDGSTTPVSINLASTTTTTASTQASDWQHYRYRVYETVIPMRNLIWGNN